MNVEVLSRQKPVPEIVERDESAGRFPPFTILLVEDQLDAQFLTTKYLEDSYSIVCAANALQALDVLKDRRFDLILMDIGLRSSLDGIELTRLIRRMEQYRFTPIIALTVHSTQQEQILFHEAGMNDCIPKPFTREQLVTTIEHWKSSRRV